MSQPQVSVLMPTFKHAAFIRRAIASLLAQSFDDWELIVVDDASPDETQEILLDYASDARIRVYRHGRNLGVGATLNEATELARGRYIAYLPSDDLYYEGHLQRLVDVLEARPEVYLAYAGVRWAYSRYEATLRGDEMVGREAEALLNPPLADKTALLNNGNVFTWVQVMHRRDYEDKVRWQTRDEIVTDRLEPNYWRGLIGCGAQIAYAGALTCEWGEHPKQHHKLIAAGHGGRSRFRQHYGTEFGQLLNWQPSYGPRMNERERYGHLLVRRDLPEPGGLKILLAGSLGFNPERIMAFEERGHKLYGLWLEEPESWDTTGPLPYGHVETVPHDRHWRERVQAIQPDVIYGLLNWQAIPLLTEVLEADLEFPFVFHFKEDPYICQEIGTWPQLYRLLTETDGQVVGSTDGLAWNQLATDGQLDPERVFILDGDLPKIDWFTDEWSPKLSDEDGEVHTVCAGRVIGMDPDELADAGVHVHFYGDHFHQMAPNFTRKAQSKGYLHLHETVEANVWVRELSRYDAAWFHIFPSYNGGSLWRANRDDLNLPARLGTYAAAGLPWILKDNRHSRVALQTLARQYDVGVFFTDYADLGQQLRDRERVRQLTANMRAARFQFAFDTHVDELIAFFQRVIAMKLSLAASEA